MPSLELLDPRKHGQLRLRPRGADFPHFVQIVVSEFAVAAAYCPILFTKELNTGGFYAGAVLGFKEGENLVGGAEEQGGFQPLMLQREGFFISDQHIAIDRAHARFSESEGDRLFDDAQQPGDALRGIQRTLGEIHRGTELTNSFIAALVEHKLIESIDISLSFDGGERLSLQGLYTVSMDRLREVGDATALRLFRAGHLQFAHTMATSLRQIPRLARLRNQSAGNRLELQPGICSATAWGLYISVALGASTSFPAAVVRRLARVAAAAIVSMCRKRAQRAALTRNRFSRGDHTFRRVARFNPLDDGAQHVELIDRARAAAAMSHAGHEEQTAPVGQWSLGFSRPRSS
jgi:hypothetical protein